MPRLEPDDQAAGLRRLLGERNAFRAVALLGPDADLNASAAAGLAFALATRGTRVCLFDETPAPHNVAGQLGLTPTLGLADLARGDAGFDAALASLPDGPGLLRAEPGLEPAAAADDRHWNRLAEDFGAGAWDWLLLAAPADERAHLALAAPARLLVLPAASNRLTEAYAVLKTAHHKQPDAVWLALFMQAEDDERTEQAMAALNDTCRRFLGIEVGLLGAVPKDPQRDLALRSMRPLHQAYPAAPATLAFRQLAGRLDERIAAAGMSAKVFWQRLGLYARLNRPPRPRSTHDAHYGRAYG